MKMKNVVMLVLIAVVVTFVGTYFFCNMFTQKKVMEYRVTLALEKLGLYEPKFLSRKPTFSVSKMARVSGKSFLVLVRNQSLKWESQNVEVFCPTHTSCRVIIMDPETHREL